MVDTVILIIINSVTYSFSKVSLNLFIELAVS